MLNAILRSLLFGAANGEHCPNCPAVEPEDGDICEHSDCKCGPYGNQKCYKCEFIPPSALYWKEFHCPENQCELTQPSTTRLLVAEDIVSVHSQQLTYREFFNFQFSHSGNSRFFPNFPFNMCHVCYKYTYFYRI